MLHFSFCDAKIEHQVKESTNLVFVNPIYNLLGSIL